MARTNIKVFIKRPGFSMVNKVAFTNVAADDEVRIPRRTPFADIANLQQLKDEGFIRTDTKVTTKYGGDNEAGSYTKLGLTLPRTEKLILLAKNPAATKVDIVISGNIRAGVEERTITLPAGEEGDIYEIDLFDLGFFIESNEEGSVILTAKNAVELLLIARY